MEFITQSSLVMVKLRVSYSQSKSARLVSCHQEGGVCKPCMQVLSWCTWAAGREQLLLQGSGGLTVKMSKQLVSAAGVRLEWGDKRKIERSHWYCWGRILSTGPITVSASILTAALTSAPQSETSSSQRHHPTWQYWRWRGSWDDENDLGGTHTL